jgi:hypothetical protein
MVIVFNATLVAVSFISGENRNNRRKQPFSRKHEYNKLTKKT